LSDETWPEGAGIFLTPFRHLPGYPKDEGGGRHPTVAESSRTGASRPVTRPWHHGKRLSIHAVGEHRAARLERASAFEAHPQLTLPRLEQRAATAQHHRRETDAVFIDEPGGKQRIEQIGAAEYENVLAVLGLQRPDRFDGLTLEKPGVVPRRLIERAGRHRLVDRIHHVGDVTGRLGPVIGHALIG